MSPIWTFLIGLAILAGFCWYFFTDIPFRKRLIGLALTLVLVAFCIESILPPKEKIRLGLDLSGGSSFLIRLVQTGENVVTPTMQDEAVAVIRKRIDQFGVGEPVITPQGTDRILVQVPGLDADKIQEAREQLQKVAKLEFKLVKPDSDQLLPRVQSGEEFLGPEWEIKPYVDEVRGEEVVTQLIVKKRADLSGDTVTEASAYFDNRGYGVGLRFNSEGARKFGELTTANVKERFAIVLDGEIKSAPVINEPITGGQATISGRFTEQEARSLSSVLENPLANPVKIEEERSVSATLGSDSIRSGVVAGLVGLAFTLLFVIVYYQAAGVVAIIGLAVNIILLFGIMSMFNFVLTLPGIAGIILTIGMAIDANVLIYERLREETAAGKSFKAAIQSAYEKAFSAIFDANVTTLITSAILFWQASGSVRGFAVTLTVGIAASMFSALLVTRNCFAWATESNLLTKVRMLNLIPAKRFNFLGQRKIAVSISLALLLACVVVFILRGERNFGIDFKGGDLITLYPDGDVSEADVRSNLAEMGFGDLPVQRSQSVDQETISIRSPFDSGEGIAAHLQATMPDAGFKVQGIEKVGPTVGRELATSSALALVLGLIGILIYVTLRFEFSFAVGALVALLHDVLITIGILALLDRELSLIMVGAILTIAGYSINDTIVVFDRVREGLTLRRKGSIESVMNASINDTLGRTILTGGTTLFSVAALYFFGGAVLRDFALAILIGVVVGTYSSIWIASPVVLWWSKLLGQNLHHEVRKTEEAKIATA